MVVWDPMRSSLHIGCHESVVFLLRTLHPNPGSVLGALRPLQASDFDATRGGFAPWLQKGVQVFFKV